MKRKTKRAARVTTAKADYEIVETPPRKDSFSFSLALSYLKEGRRLQRTGWNGKGMWVEMQRPDEHSKMTLPYLFMSTAQGDLVPWLISQTDALAEDWELFQ